MLGSAELGGSRHISWTSRPCWTLQLVIIILDNHPFLLLTLTLWLPKIIMVLSPRVFIRQEGALRQQVGHQASQEAVRLLLFFSFFKVDLFSAFHFVHWCNFLLVTCFPFVWYLQYAWKGAVVPLHLIWSSYALQSQNILHEKKLYFHSLGNMIYMWCGRTDKNQV